jgi:hypothetical protein
VIVLAALTATAKTATWPEAAPVGFAKDAVAENPDVEVDVVPTWATATGLPPHVKQTSTSPYAAIGESDTDREVSVNVLPDAHACDAVSAAE